jgi:NitT/TauT family transport system ATP-binding protein
MSMPILAVHELGITFPDRNGGLKVLEDISFTVQPSEFVCLLGPSGSGKTTLLRILAGLLKPGSGEYHYSGGQPGIGMVFQQSNLLPWRTALENVTLPLELQGLPAQECQRRAGEIIDLVGLKDFAVVWPRDLSGGMAQRLAIARALVHDPDILLLDEPFGSLDAMTREHMWTELSNIWQLRRKTVLMVTHSISEALFLADRVLVLTQRPGRIKLDLAVSLPRPRLDEMRYTYRFGEYARRLK